MVREFAGSVLHRLYWPILIMLLMLIVLDVRPINHDCLLQLEMGKMLVQGKVPYVDFGDFNPPLILYLNAIPALAAKIFAVDAASLFQLFVWSIVVWSVLFVERLWIRSELQVTQADTTLTLLSLSLFSLTAYILNSFGERDFLFIVLFLPFFVTRWIRWQGGKVKSYMALATGVAGAVGACLKPYFVVIAVVLEVFWVMRYWQTRNLWQTETIAFSLTGLCYAIHFLLLPSIVKANFFELWLPFVISRYSAYNQPVTTLLQMRTFWFVLVAALAPMAIVGSRARGLWRMTPSISVLALGCLAVFFWQHKGWLYHLMPSLASASLLVGMVATETFAFAEEQGHAKSFKLRATTSGCCMFLYALVVIVGAGAALRSAHAEGDAEMEMPFGRIISEYSSKGDAILTIATSASAGSPLYTTLMLGRRPAHRYFYTFWMGMLYAEAQPDENGRFPYRSRTQAIPEEARFIAELEEDIAKNNPKLIFVRAAENCEGCPPRFNIMEYLTKIGTMDAILKNHNFLTISDGHAVFVTNNE